MTGPGTATVYLPSNASNVARWTFYMLVFLAGFMPMEDFILKFLPGPDIVYLASRFISELMIYCAFAWTLWHKISLGAPFLRTPLDGMLALLFAACATSLVVNLGGVYDNSFFEGALNLRPMFRYILLFYVVVNTPLSSRQVGTIISAIILSGVVQVLLGLGQFAAGGALDAFLAPRETSIEVAGQSQHFRILEGTREIGAIHGPATDTIFFALSMNYLFLVCVSRMRAGLIFFQGRRNQSSQAAPPRNVRLALTKADKFVIFLLPFVLLAGFLSYVRASQLIMLLIIGLELVYWLGRRIGLLFLVLGILFLAVVITAFPPDWKGGGATQQATDPISDFTSIFSMDYLENNLKNQRLHQLVGIAPTVFLSRPIFGYGPTERTVVEAVNEAKPSFLFRKITLEEFQDVYWVAVFAKYGLTGLMIFVAIFYLLFRSANQVYARADNPVLKEVALMVVYSIVLASIILFFNRAYELRVFGFYFWLLPGLMFSLVNHSDCAEKFGLRTSPTTGRRQRRVP